MVPAIFISNLFIFLASNIGTAVAKFSPPEDSVELVQKRIDVQRVLEDSSQDGAISCLEPSTNRGDPGYYDNYRGWYDVQGCGKCNDYCRWVGGSGSGGDPTQKLVHKKGTSWNSWWSCRLAGTSNKYTWKDHFGSWSFVRCDGEGASPIFESCKPTTSRADAGYYDSYKGWYDVQGCGTCNDYCRWVGSSGSGGDPTQKLVHGNSWWSCRLAGTSQIYSPREHFSVWSFVRCDGEGASTPEPCKPTTSRSDAGYADDYRGWYDVQGCGICNDYCRWVGTSGSGGDPTQKMVHDGSWWSCRLAGTSKIYSPVGHFSSWSFAKCDKEGVISCLEPTSNRADPGYYDDYRGWYDVHGCGKCNDYCRWVGGSGSGGDPTQKLVHKKGTSGDSWWSCRLSGTSAVHSLKGHFSSWNFSKCEKEGASPPEPCKPTTNRADGGYADEHNGWYDVQGCGTCNDYCRWVGGSGSGGDPTKKLVHQKGDSKESFWSCRLAGTSQTYTWKGHFSTWNFMKCTGEGAAAPPLIPPATPYVPGEPGSAWTAEEMLTLRAKIHRMFNEGWELQHELGVTVPPPKWVSTPGAAKVLRLGFHDCLKYTDGTGGCDGCLQWDGVEHRYTEEQLMKGIIDGKSRPDGHNNGLSPTVKVLEAIYTDRDFPQRTPLLPLSPQQSGKSRADLWAFAVIEAVKYSMDLNNMACEDSEALLKKGINQCHPRVNKDDGSCSVTVPDFSFKTGRKDCISSASLSFISSKTEMHPNPKWNGSQVIDYFQNDFNFTGRETVAIMGAHTLGRVHEHVSLNRYTWKTRSARLFNNGYYRNMVKKLDWFYDGYFTTRSTPCTDSTIGNSSGQPPESRWVPHVRGDTSLGGPVQWINEKFACPTCEATPDDPCCSGVPRGTCKPGCDAWRFIIGLDEIMLNSDMGLYLQFDVGANGIPSGCTGFEDFNLESWKPWAPNGGFTKYHNTWTRVNGQKAEPLCSFNSMSVPPGSTPLYQVVQEYADEQAKFISDFAPALEKMLSNGYSDSDLQSAPANGMSGYSCPFQIKSDHQRSYVCTFN